MQVESRFDCKTSPLEIRNIVTGQKIMFRGMDDPMKITSISVTVGVLNLFWIEEAYQIPTEAAFDMIDESLRGNVPDGYFKQIVLTFNPWHEAHWLKSRFFDRDDDPRVFATTTTYECNEWLDEADRANMEQLRIRNPRRFQVAGLGNWGITDGLVLENWEMQEFDIDEVRKRSGIQACFGMDFGYSVPAAFVSVLIDTKMHEIFICDEMYRTGMSVEDIAAWITQHGYQKEIIQADSAEPRTIDNLRTLGLRRIRECKKGTVMEGIRFLQDFKIFVHPRCINFISEISQYSWQIDKKTGRATDKPIDDFNHLIDALRYAVGPIAAGKTFQLRKTK